VDFRDPPQAQNEWPRFAANRSKRAAARSAVEANHEAKGFRMFEIVAVVFVIGCAVALVGWWNGPDIPRN
jgi:cytochrome c-type biogenesis protein CcmH/NrfG